MQSHPSELRIYETEQGEVPFGLTITNAKMPTSRSYHSYLIESLRDPQEAAAYLDAVLEDCNYAELSLALRNVAEARLTMLGSSQAAFNKEIARKLLSPEANIELPMLLKTLGELGFKLSVDPSDN